MSDVVGAFAGTVTVLPVKKNQAFIPYLEGVKPNKMLALMYCRYGAFDYMNMMLARGKELGIFDKAGLYNPEKLDNNPKPLLDPYHFRDKTFQGFNAQERKAALETLKDIDLHFKQGGFNILPVEIIQQLRHEVNWLGMLLKNHNEFKGTEKTRIYGLLLDRTRTMANPFDDLDFTQPERP